MSRIRLFRRFWVFGWKAGVGFWRGRGDFADAGGSGVGADGAAGNILAVRPGVDGYRVGLAHCGDSLVSGGGA